VSNPAHAQSARPSEGRSIPLGYAERPFHLELMTGVATAVGLLGVRGEVNLGDPISLGLGVGTNAHGALWEAHARWRIVHGVRHSRAYHALTLEGAFSRARYAGVDFEPSFGLGESCDKVDPRSDCYDPPVVPQTVNWGQAELGWEEMFPTGITFRISAGLAHQIGSYHWQCSSLDVQLPCARDLPAETLFVFSLALGYAF